MLEKLPTDGWHELSLGPIQDEIEEENPFESGISDPKTKTIAFVLAIASCPAIARAFPHRLLAPWVEARMGDRTRHLFEVADASGYAIATPSVGTLRALLQTGIVKSSSYKVSDNSGCEFGGLRSFLGTNLATFTARVAAIWDDYTPDTTSQKSPVPILPVLDTVLRSGGSIVALATSYSRTPIKGKNCTLEARGMLWLQITLLDTWIGCKIDEMMGKVEKDEVPVPATVSEAERCLKLSMELSQTTLWNPLRLRWLQMYMQRLIDGNEGRGESFLSEDVRPERSERWVGMEKGEPSEWLMLDAVITTRAALMCGMLQLLDDSSVLLDLRLNDPSLYIS